MNIYRPSSHVSVETGCGLAAVTTMYRQVDGGPRRFIHVFGRQTEPLGEDQLERVENGRWCRNPNMPSYRRREA